MFLAGTSGISTRKEYIMADIGSGGTMGGALERIREGMDVYDRDGDKIGTVSDVYFGAGTGGELPGQEPPTVPDQNMRSGDTLIDRAASVFGARDVPEVVQTRLRQKGYFRLDGGLLSGDRYVTPDQIAEVRGDDVILRIGADEVIEV
jgi:hypothetical protein